MDGISFDIEGASRGWVRNEQGQYAIYDIGLLTDEIIEAGSIENVEYDRTDWGESYWLYDEGSYEAYFEILELDAHQFVISTYHQKTITGKAVFWPQVQPGAKLRITFASDADPSSVRMVIDDNGDGETDRTLEPDGAVAGRAACEAVEPAFTAEVEEIEPGLAQLALRGEDNEGGSGVAGIEFILFDEIPDPTQELSTQFSWPARYNEPVLIDKGSLVMFHGWDNAGNMTFWEEVVVLGGLGPDVTGTIQIGGDPVHIETPLPGQNALLTFEGQAGQHVAAVISENTYGQSPSHIAGYLRILDPAGEVIASSHSFGSLDEIVKATLEVDGTHTVVVDPFAITTGAANVTLYAPDTIEGTITPGGAPATLDLTTPGQSAELTFTGSAGQRLVIDAIVTNVTSEGCLQIADDASWTHPCAFVVEMLAPNGESVAKLGGIDERGNQSETITLPATGAYTLTVKPLLMMMGVVDVRLLTFDSSATVSVGGPPLTIELPRPGDVSSVGFAGEAGKTYLVQLTDVTVGSEGCCSGNYWIVMPNGERADFDSHGWAQYDQERPAIPADGIYVSNWDTGLPWLDWFGTDGAEFLLTTPEAGQYVLVLDPNEDTTGGVTIAIRELGPVKVDAAVNGPPVDLAIEYREQPGIVQFDGTKRQTIRITASVQPGSDPNFKMYSTRFRLIAPDGDVVYVGEGDDEGIASVRATLPADGVYWLEIVNPPGRLATISIGISSS